MQPAEHLAQREPGRQVIAGRNHGNDGLHLAGIARPQGLDPGQLLDQVAGKRPFRLVQQLRQLAGGDDPRRAELQLPRFGLLDEDLEQAAPGPAARQGKYDVLQVELPCGCKPLEQVINGGRQGRPAPIEETTLDGHSRSPALPVVLRPFYKN